VCFYTVKENVVCYESSSMISNKVLALD